MNKIKHLSKSKGAVARHLHLISLLACMLLSMSACGDNEDEPEIIIEDENTYVLKSTTEQSKKLKGDGSEGNPYMIVTAADLKYFIEAVNCDDIDSQLKYFQLGHDLEVDKDYEWSAIGNDLSPFKGHFNGDGHSINGTLNHKTPQKYPDHLGELNADELPEKAEFFTGTYYFGLFGVCMYEGIISNLTLNADVIIVPSIEEGEPEKKIYVGSIAAHCDGTTFKNCTVNNQLSVQGNFQLMNNSGTLYAIGGICGFLTGHMEKCTKKGELSMEYAQATGILIGGLCGDSGGAVLTDCYNSTQFAIEAPTCVEFSFGGICGSIDTYRYVYGDNSITNCENESELYCERCSLYGENARVHIGGIIGYLYTDLPSGKAEKLIFSGCKNKGKIVAPLLYGSSAYSVEVGGMAGMLRAQYDNDNGYVMKDCENHSDIYGSSHSPAKYHYTGGLVGYAENVDFLNCENHGEITGSFPKAEAEEEMQATSGIVGFWIPCFKSMHACSSDGEIPTIGGSKLQYIGNLAGFIGVSSRDELDLQLPCIFDCNKYVSPQYAVGNYMDRNMFGECAEVH